MPTTAAPTIPTSSIGYAAGVDGYNGLLADFLEDVPALRWPDSIATYDRMRRDPQITAVLTALTLPIRRASWILDPNGARPAAVQLVAEDLGLPILGAQDNPPPTRRRGVKWAEHLRLAMLHLVFGHMPFEQRYDVTSGQARLVALSERMPSTVQEIRVAKDGALQGIVQYPLTGLATESQLIPADRLAWYAHEREGAHWQGRSVLRAAYGPWLFKHEMQRVLATSSRRFGMGIPQVKAPPGGNPQQTLEASRLASSMRSGEQAGMGVPHGFEASLIGLTGSVPDTLGFIRYLDEQIAKAALAQFLDLGTTATGSRALGSTFVDFFSLALQATAEEVASTATEQVVLDMVDLNWGQDEPAPRVTVADVGAEHSVTAESLSLLLGSGALAPDPELEAYVRDEWGLPQRTGPAPVAAPVNAKGGRRSVRAATSGPFRRQMTAVEAAAKTDFTAVQDVWQTALDRLLADWQGVTAAQRADLRQQIIDAVEASDIEALGALTVDTGAAAKVLEEAMVALAAEAAQQQADEAADQGVTVKPGGVDVGRLGLYAGAVAAIIGSGLGNAAGRDALRRLTTDPDPQTLADQVEAYLVGLSDSYLADQLGGAMSAAQNEGRLATLADAPAPEVLAASEILDAATCGPCSDIDGHVFDSLDEAEAAYASGGYVDCDGGLRCRGILVAVWDAATVEQAA